MSQAPSFWSFPEDPSASVSTRPTQSSPPIFSSFPDIDALSSDLLAHSPSTRQARLRHEGSYGLHRPKRRDDNRGERDERMERKRKEEKRQTERERASALVKGETMQHAGQVPERVERPGRSLVKKIEVNDGTPWYEVSGKEIAKPGYQEPINPNLSNTFFLDTAGDKEAIKYGNSSSNNAPRYYRDERRVLGVSDGLRIVNSKEETQRGLQLAPLGRPYIPRYSARPLEAASDRHLRRLLVRPDSEDTDFDSRANFVSFDAHSERQIDASDVPSYRNVSRAYHDGEDDRPVEVSLGRFSTLEADVRSRTAEMERYLRRHPDDVDCWISYSTLHLKLSSEIKGRPTSFLIEPAQLPQTRANAEITLSILARALDSHEKNMASAKLHIAYLHTAEAFWPASSVTERWKNVLRELEERGSTEVDEGMMEVWLGYIQWREGQGFGKSTEGREGVGGVDEVVDVYTDCLARFYRNKSFGANEQVVEENQVYLFVRVCLFLKQAGYTERALSIFQALIEITFFKPQDLRPAAGAGQEWFEHVLARFETFWDTESPRIGESGARGWRASSKASVQSSPGSVPPTSHSSNNPFERWYEAERHAEKYRSLPSRATDLGEDDEDDPYRVVLFFDLKPFLFPIKSPEVRLQLIYAFINFLGLPFTPPDIPTTTLSVIDPHLQWSLTYNTILRSKFWPRRESIRRSVWQTVGGEPMEPEQPRALQTPFTCPVKCWAQARSTLFSQSSTWFRELDALDLECIDVNLVRNVFDLLRPIVTNPAFDLASFSFEAAVSPKSAVKMAKSLLASDRENLVLWDGYARLERQRGNIDAARAVYVTAIRSRDSAVTDETGEDAAELWSAWAEMEWDVGEEVRCLEVLVMAAGMDISRLEGCANPAHTASKPSPVALLKSRLHYASLRPPQSSARLIQSALFAYLANDVDAACKVIYEQIDKFPSGSYDAEEGHQVLCKLLFTHCIRHAAPAALARQALENAISSYPNNTLFLSLYLWGEMGGRVYGRIQRLVSHLISASSECAGVIGYLWSVWAEAMAAHRTFWDEGGCGAERVRNALDKSINTSLGRHSAALWKLYVEFETLMGHTSVAKQLCYRAITLIGGCKALYLLPFDPSLRPSFTSRELRDWADLMTERGIRVRTPFEQFWDLKEEDDIMELREDEELEDDELEVLKERQRLKPY